MRRRIIGAVLAVTLAAVGTFVLVIYVRGAEDRALAGEATVDVLVVRELISRGTAAADLASYVTTERIPVKVQAEGSVGSVDDIPEDQVAAVDLLPGEQLVSDRFMSPQDLLAQTQVEVPDGLLQVTVSLTPERAVGGQLRPGATAAILASFDPFEIGAPLEDEEEPDRRATRRTPNSTHLILHKVLVTNVQVEELPQEDEEGTSAQLAPTGNLLVTLALEAPAVEEVVFTAEHGHLWLAVEPDDAPEDGTRIQTRDTIYQ